jgi:hypothetical protein
LILCDCARVFTPSGPVGGGRRLPESWPLRVQRDSARSEKACLSFLRTNPKHPVVAARSS